MPVIIHFFTKGPLIYHPVLCSYYPLNITVIFFLRYALKAEWQTGVWK
jgi:hypothetical protein